MKNLNIFSGFIIYKFTVSTDITKYFMFKKTKCGARGMRAQRIYLLAL